MDWIPLDQESQLEEIRQKSFSRAQVILKYSVLCSLSATIKDRLDRSEVIGDADFYWLDLIRYRSISNKIAETYGVQHKSPQTLTIRNGQCVYHESHMGISMEKINKSLTEMLGE
ncbi:MAG: bacillithiol system redox-active protein YtxJ [Chitinophagaceae bacterium]|nr:bacillithiol system redox-active protein YtxJ [Chitinophagaceae bacterium]